MPRAFWRLTRAATSVYFARTLVSMSSSSLIWIPHPRSTSSAVYLFLVVHGDVPRAVEIGGDLDRHFNFNRVRDYAWSIVNLLWPASVPRLRAYLPQDGHGRGVTTERTRSRDVS